MENQQDQTENPGTEKDSIFSGEEFSMEGYDKHIRQARNALYVCAGILFINVAILYFSLPAGYEYVWIDLLVYGFFIAGFVLLAIWTKSKPYNAIIGGLILFGSFLLLQLWIDSASLFKGFLWKIFIIVYLVKALGDAKRAQELKRQLEGK